jgi:tRNA U55 pseudouridine synthase TruB
MTKRELAKGRMPKWVVLHKKRGETPLEALSAWKVANPEFAEVPASYAGRLDPMAEGKLLVLLGDECKRQDAYTKLDKEYEIEVLLDVGTDTGDALGMPEYLSGRQREDSNKFLNAYEIFSHPHAAFAPHLRQVLDREVGMHSRRYPAFSSKTVNGKPLFLYALEGTLNEIQIPEHIERMYKIKLEDTYQLDGQQLRDRIQELLRNVSRSDEPSKLLGADFRQDAIRERWDELLATVPDEKFTILKLRVVCGSGAYMRTLAERIGTSLGTNALALTINRTKIGKYVRVGRIGFWVKAFK